VLLFDGLDTVTPAKAVFATAMKPRMAVLIKTCFFISVFLSGLGILVWTGRTILLRGIDRSCGNTLGHAPLKSTRGTP